MGKINDTAVFLKDAVGSYLHANDAFARLMGISGAFEMIGRSNSSLFAPELAAELDREDEETLAAGEPRETERELSDSEGRRFVYRFRRFPVAFGGRQTVFCLVERNDPAVIPVTAEARARFFSAVSHDLRSPLNAIVGYAQLLQQEQDPRRFREAVTAIGEGSRLLISAVDGLLTLIGPEASAAPVKFETFNVAEATIGVAESFAAAAAENDVELLVKHGELPLVEFAGAQYRDILGRLLDYAVHRTSGGEVSVRTVYRDGTLRFSVTDSGRYLSDAEVERVLNPAKESDESEPTASATLNLTVAKRLVERLGGSFDIRNESGDEKVGVSVTVTFVGVTTTDVLKRAEFARTQKMRTMRIEDPFRFDKQILIVDDRAVNLRILSLLLGALGFRHVTTAAGGERALELVKAGKFDVVLTDLMMPGMDGRELLREIRRLPGCGKMPVYAVTADTSAPVTCANDGFTGILIKPVTKDVLKEVL